MNFDLTRIYEKLALYFLRKTGKNSNLLGHAKTELCAIGYSPESEDGPNKWVYDGVTDLVRLFSMQEHSGFSAPHILDIFNKVARFTPLAPLTGEDDEWLEIDEGMFQNKRASTVFKRTENGIEECYNIDGRAFQYEGDNCWFTSIWSRTPVEFPYTIPETEYVIVTDCRCIVHHDDLPYTDCTICDGSGMMRADGEKLGYRV